MKQILGNLLHRLYEHHLNKALCLPFDTEDDERKHNDYFTFGFGDFKFKIILNNSEDMVKNGDYTGCTSESKTGAMMNWYKYGFIYNRVWHDTPGGIFAKLIRILS